MANVERSSCDRAVIQNQIVLKCLGRPDDSHMRRQVRKSVRANQHANRAVCLTRCSRIGGIARKVRQAQL